MTTMGNAGKEGALEEYNPSYSRRGNPYLRRDILRVPQIERGLAFLYGFQVRSVALAMTKLQTTKPNLYRIFDDMTPFLSRESGEEICKYAGVRKSLAYHSSMFTCGMKPSTFTFRAAGSEAQQAIIEQTALRIVEMRTFNWPVVQT